MKKCDCCGTGRIETVPHKVKGKLPSGRRTTRTVWICLCCDAWGFLSKDWYGYEERLEAISGLTEAKIVLDKHQSR